MFYQTLSHLVPNPVTPCAILCHSLYQTLSQLVPDFVTPCIKPCNTIPGFVTHISEFLKPCTKPCHTFYQTLSHLVPNPVTPCTRICHTLYQKLPTPCTGTPEDFLGPKITHILFLIQKNSVRHEHWDDRIFAPKPWSHLVQNPDTPCTIPC